ncbi:DUF4177 domain-containing protein [Cribrihabitans pelagius]|uniref:DUF4177 domain-containing protein n=1 Tax=Cribrihabitans pelagius TaxID=1765746 RepID=UPI003B59DBBC
MQAFEYKVVPAPAKGTKAKGLKGPEARFANSIELLLNEMAAEGWEFQRAEILPSEERAGLASSTTNWRNLLVFRRAVAAERPGDAPGGSRREPAAPAVSFRHSEAAAPPLAAAPDTREAPALRRAEPARPLGAAGGEAQPDVRPAPRLDTGSGAAEARPGAQAEEPGADAAAKTPGERD